MLNVKGKKSAESSMVYVTKVLKGDTFLVLADSAAELEDEYSGQYFRQTSTAKLFLEPTFLPKSLMKLVYQNNTLAQCIEAMELNIDGTGHEFVPEEEGEIIPQKEQDRLNSFFKEPYPGTDFVSVRRDLRRDIESAGYGGLELLRNIAGEMVGLRKVITQSLRMVKLDDEVKVTKTVERDGKEVQLTMWERERRFVQCISNGGDRKYIYFREYGASRQLHRDTGEWETKAKPVPVENRASDLLFFGVHPDVETPYFIPRWINNLPSVVGGRKAEEENLLFFDAGGMPPAIIFVGGGQMSNSTSDQLKNFLSGMNKNRSRAVVVEIPSTSGAIDTSSPVNVKVERFGAEGKQDPMFASYDKIASEHVREAFRLPGLFIGRMVDMSLASAVTAYMVAEAQVFKPERDEFDTIMNRTIMKELKASGVQFRSLPVTLNNVDAKLRSLALAGPVVTGKSYVDELNKASGMSLEYQEPPVLTEDGQTPTDATESSQKPPGEGTEGLSEPLAESNRQQDGTKLPKVKSAHHRLIKLANDYAKAYQLLPTRKVPDAEEFSRLEKEMARLSPQEDEMFHQLVAAMTTGNAGLAPVVKHHDHSHS